MIKLNLHKTKHSKSYSEKINLIKNTRYYIPVDYKLDLLASLLKQTLIFHPNRIIEELKNGLNAINYVEFEYEDGRVIIREGPDCTEDNTYISIEEDQLYEIINKYAQLTSKGIPTIILTRDGENYGIEEG